MLEWIDTGWKLAEFSSVSGTFFCTKGVERREVSVTRSDPHVAPTLSQGRSQSI